MWGKRVASRARSEHATQRTVMSDIDATVVARLVCNGLHPSVLEGPSSVKRAMHTMPQRSSIRNQITLLKSKMTCNTLAIKEIGHQVDLAIDQPSVGTTRYIGFSRWAIRLGRKRRSRDVINIRMRSSSNAASGGTTANCASA